MRNIFATLGQLRHGERHHSEPVIEILAHIAGGNFGRQILAGRRNNTHINRYFLMPAHAAKTLLGHGAHNLALGFQRQVADFIEIERAFMRLFEQPDNTAVIVQIV